MGRAPGKHKQALPDLCCALGAGRDWRKTALPPGPGGHEGSHECHFDGVSIAARVAAATWALRCAPVRPRPPAPKRELCRWRFTRVEEERSRLGQESLRDRQIWDCR